MDFLFDEDETELIGEFARVLSEFEAPWVSDNHLDTWAKLHELGWLSHQTSPDYKLSSAVIAGLMKEAGRVLQGDEYLNNAFILPSLCNAIIDVTERGAALERLHDRPGFLLVDGREERFDRISEGNVSSCFGVGVGFDAYDVRQLEDGALTLRVFGPESVTAIERWANLSLSIANVDVSPVPDDEYRIGVDLQRLFADATLFHAATLVGLAEIELDVTVNYVISREQFGGPIGRFQSIKHALADVAVRNEISWRTVLFAAASIDVASNQLIRASALINAAHAAQAASKTMAQFHGGFGYTWEAPVHYYLKRALESSSRFGGADAAAERVGKQMVGSHA